MSVRAVSTQWRGLFPVWIPRHGLPHVARMSRTWPGEGWWQGLLPSVVTDSHATPDSRWASLYTNGGSVGVGGLPCSDTTHYHGCRWHWTALRPNTLTPDAPQSPEAGRITWADTYRTQTALYRAGSVSWETFVQAVYPRPWTPAPCTCQFGTCLRPSHRPANAQCGHAGVFGHAGGLSHCYRLECEESARIACGIIALTRGASRNVTTGTENIRFLGSPDGGGMAPEAPEDPSEDPPEAGSWDLGWRITYPDGRTAVVPTKAQARGVVRHLGGSISRVR